jgi:hypothetical protein
VGATTVARAGRFTRLKSDIYVSPGIKGLSYGGHNGSRMVINHELIHAWHISIGMPNYNTFSERITSQYTMDYITKYNMMGLYNVTRPELGPYPAKYGWRMFQLLNRNIFMGL